MLLLHLEQPFLHFSLFPSVVFLLLLHPCMVGLLGSTQLFLQPYNALTLLLLVNISFQYVVQSHRVSRFYHDLVEQFLLRHYRGAATHYKYQPYCLSSATFEAEHAALKQEVAYPATVKTAAQSKETPNGF